MNKIQKIGAVVAAVALTALATQVSAMTVGWSASGPNPTSVGLTLADQTTGVASGSFIALGNFGTLADPTIANPVAIWATFQAYQTSTIGDGTFTDGTFQTAGTGNTGLGWFSELAYLVVFNNADPNLATQVGVFKGNLSPTVGDSWSFPINDAADPKSLTTDDLGLASVVIGSFQTSGFDNGWSGLNNTPSLSLAIAVPEPSSLMLAGLGLLGMVGLLRRRS